MSENGRQFIEAAGKRIEVLTDPYYGPEVDGKRFFDVDTAVVLMLADGEIFVGSNMRLVVNANDVFAWGCADAEEFGDADVEALYSAWVEGKVTKWLCKKRNEKPQPPLEQRMRERGDWDDELEALPCNYTDRAVHQQIGATCCYSTPDTAE
jgi:hypothetical protein